MKLRRLILFILVLASFTSCKKKVDPNIPPSLANRIFEGTITSGSGAYADMIGYKFKSTFDEQHHFVTTPDSGESGDAGEYHYKASGNQGELKLIAQNGPETGQEVTVILKFTSVDDGVFEGRQTKGEKGEYTGVFSLK